VTTVELDRAVAADFAPRVGEAFVASGLQVSLELTQAQALPENPDYAPRRYPFRLEFRGPIEPLLPQGTYALENATLNVIEVFIVPIGPDEAGQRYEAVFN
jgi:hypothetical protein